MKRSVLLLPIASGALFGSAGVFVRILTGAGMDNPTVLFSRTAFATLCLLAFLLAGKRSCLALKAKDVPLFIGTGVFGMVGLNLCYNEAVNSLSLSLAAVLLSTAPVFVVALAAVLFGEAITRRKVLCIPLVIFGCVLTSGLLEDNAGIAASFTGMGFGVGAAVFYALYTVVARKAADAGYHTYTVIFYSVLFASIALLPFADLAAIGGFVAAAPATGTAFLLAHALCTSVLPYVFLTLALHHAEAGKVSILASGAEPAAASLFGLLFYGETPSALMVLGLALTIAALAMLCLPGSPREQDKTGV